MNAPFTEELFRRAFVDQALITAKAAAQLLGMDEKTLSSMVEAGQIRAVKVGKLKRFTEADLRRYLETALHTPRAATVGDRGTGISQYPTFTEIRLARQKAKAKRTRRSQDD